MRANRLLGLRLKQAKPLARERAADCRYRCSASAWRDRQNGGVAIARVLDTAWIGKTGALSEPDVRDPAWRAPRV
ncbi:MAG: hypothetical protein AAF471_02050 [Myxococcota bacterium]